MKIRILSAQDVSKALTMEQAIAVLWDTFISITKQQVTIPPRIIMPWEPTKLAVFMPAAVKHLGIKIATLVPNQQPMIQGLVVLLDKNTGTPTALIEGSTLTSLKTGAASGVATKLLAKPNASSVALIGCGTQARAQLTAMCTVRPIQKVWLYDHVRSQATKLAQELTIPYTITANIRDAVQHADIICTATTATTPIVTLADLKPQTHINAVGGHSLTSREVCKDIINQALVVVEQRAATLSESCEKHFSELGELIQNPTKTVTYKKFTLFASVGIAALDISIAAAILQNAITQQLGSIITL